MQNIGAYLRQCREETGRSIEEVAEATRIKPYLLEDIEKNDFSRLGGYGFAKVTLISYARNLNADLDRTVLLFEQSYRADREQRHAFDKTEPQRKMLLPGNTFLIFAVVGLIIVLSVVVWRLHSTGKLSFGLQDAMPLDSVETVIDETPADEQEPPAQIVDEPEEQPDEQQAAQADTSHTQQPESEEEPTPEALVAAEPIAPQASSNDALRDTTDYVARHVFLSDNNPLNIKLKDIPSQAR